MRETEVARDLFTVTKQIRGKAEIITQNSPSRSPVLALPQHASFRETVLRFIRSRGGGEYKGKKNLPKIRLREQTLQSR